MLSSETLILYNATDRENISIEPLWLSAYNYFVLVGDNLDALNLLALSLEDSGKQVLIADRLEDIADDKPLWKNAVTSRDVNVVCLT